MFCSETWVQDDDAQRLAKISIDMKKKAEIVHRFHGSVGNSVAREFEELEAEANHHACTFSEKRTPSSYFD